MVRIPVKTSSCGYEGVIEQNVLARAGVVLRALLGSAQPLFVVTVPPVRRRWGRVLLQSLEASGFSPMVLEMRDGELVSADQPRLEEMKPQTTNYEPV